MGYESPIFKCLTLRARISHGPEFGRLYSLSARLEEIFTIEKRSIDMGAYLRLLCGRSHYELFIAVKFERKENGLLIAFSSISALAPMAQ